MLRVTTKVSCKDSQRADREPATEKPQAEAVLRAGREHLCPQASVSALQALGSRLGVHFQKTHHCPMWQMWKQLLRGFGDVT